MWRRLTGGVAALLLMLSLSLGAALAQQPDTPDYADWDKAAARAERTLASDAAADPALEELRGQLAQWRESFLSAQSTNQTRIDTVRGQIDALGPPPEEGKTEPEAIAKRRKELNDQLSKLEAPVHKAEEAYNRADGLIHEVDEILRARQTDQLLELGPAPVNPVHWPGAVASLLSMAENVGEELVSNWRDPSARESLWQNVPVAVLLVAVALALLARGRSWMVRLTLALSHRWRGHGRGVFVFIVSLGQVAVPVLGIALLTWGIEVLSILGPYSRAIVQTLFILGLAFFGGRWLGQGVFPPDASMPSALDLSERARTEGRIYSGSLGLLLGLDVLLRRLLDLGKDAPGPAAVLEFPLILLTGVILLRLGQLLAREAGVEDEEPRFSDRVARALGRLLMLLGVIGPALAAVGYLNAARQLTFPATLSLALIAFLAIAYFLARDLYALVRRVPVEEAEQALVPVLASLALTVASLPVFALIWGARRTDLAELWSRFREGFAIGDTRLSPGDFVTFLAVFAVGFLLTRLVQGMLRNTVLPKTRMDTGGRNAVVSGLGYVGICLAGLAAITSAGIDLSNLAIVAGALSVGIGFGLQNIVSNFVSGIILLIERPISQGDWIEVGGKMGIVKDISVRSTRIETFDRTDVIVPNADFVSNSVTNWTRGNVTGRITVSVGVSYRADSRKVEAILREICESHPMVAVTPAPAVYFRRFGADALEFDCFCILRDVNYMLVVHSELNHQVMERFREEGIEIPFAQRDIWLRNPEDLPGAPAGAGGAETPPPEQGPETGPREKPSPETAAPDTWERAGDEPDGDGR